MLNPEPDFDVLDQPLDESDKVFALPDVSRDRLVQDVLGQDGIGQGGGVVSLHSGENRGVLLKSNPTELSREKLNHSMKPNHTHSVA